MATKTAVLVARLEPTVKKEAEKIFKELGLSTSEAINVFFNQVRLRRGLPFDVGIPNQKESTARKEKSKASKATGTQRNANIPR